MMVVDNVYFQYIKLVFENVCSYYFVYNDLLLGCDVLVFSSSFLFGGQVLCYQISICLGGENSNLCFNLLVMLVKNEVCDSCIWFDYQVGYCISCQLYKIIVSDKGWVVFNGLINVVLFVLKIDGQMINNNLLFGWLVEVDIKLQLEIYVDDVKCSYGVMVGCIDEEQLFYLCL